MAEFVQSFEKLAFEDSTLLLELQVFAILQNQKSTIGLN
jgi:hypothetical protein